jgi:BlaI family penicillinase repressor
MPEDWHTERALTAKSLEQLSRRERQIMEIVLRRGQATAAEVHEDLLDPPTYTAVRGTLTLLVKKGFLRHEYDGPRYVYLPTVDAKRARTSAVRHLVRTFFDDSAGAAVAAMVGMFGDKLSEEELETLQQAIDKARTAKGGTP